MSAFGGDAGGSDNPFDVPFEVQATSELQAGVQLPLAGRGRRLVGSLIDTFLGLVAVIPGFILMGFGIFSAAAAGPGGIPVPPGAVQSGPAEEFGVEGTELSPFDGMEVPGSDVGGEPGLTGTPGGIGGPGGAAVPPMLIGSVLGGFALIGLSVLVIFGLQIYLLVTRSQTVGKILTRTLIVDYRTGQRAGAVSCVLLRFFVHGVITAIPNIGGLYGLVDALFIFRQDRRCLHDLIASTAVVELPRN